MTDYWKFRDQFIEVLDQRYYPIEWLDQRLLNGRAHLICSQNAAIVVELRQYPGGAMDVHGLIAAGERKAILELIGEAEAWGKENGCIAGVIESRPAWVKLARPLGYEVSQVTVRKEL